MESYHLVTVCALQGRVSYTVRNLRKQSLCLEVPASTDKVLLVVNSVKVAGEVSAVGNVLLVVSMVEFVVEVVPAGDAEAAPAH